MNDEVPPHRVDVRIDRFVLKGFTPDDLKRSASSATVRRCKKCRSLAPQISNSG